MPRDRRGSPRSRGEGSPWPDIQGGRANGDRRADSTGRQAGSDEGAVA